MTFKELVDVGVKAMRLYLAFIITTLYNIILAWAVVKDKITVVEYITAVGPTNAMIVGFLFGEKAALKNPGKDE